MYTDDSDNCIGACLTQKTDEGEEKPIHYLSHKLSKTQERWSTIEREAYAIHHALQKLDHYLHNATFTIKTDFKPLKYILDAPMQNKKIQLWALSIARYNCKVEYIEGRYNCWADLLSRLPSYTPDNKEGKDENEPDANDNTFEISAIHSNRIEPKLFVNSDFKVPDDLIKLFLDLPENIDGQKLQKSDEQIVKLKERIEKGKATRFEEQKFLEIEGLLYYLAYGDSESPRLRLYVPQKLEEITLKQYHDNLGHMAVD